MAGHTCAFCTSRLFSIEFTPDAVLLFCVVCRRTNTIPIDSLVTPELARRVIREKVDVSGMSVKDVSD